MCIRDRLLTTLALTASMAACGGSSSSDTTTAAAGSSAAAADTSAAEAQTVYRTLDEIKESGTINIGVFSDKNPFGYVDENEMCIRDSIGIMRW